MARMRVGRVAISKRDRQGHPKWTEMDCWYHPAQVWTASDEAISRAAIAGRDQSTWSHRNLLNEASIPEHLTPEIADLHGLTYRLERPAGAGRSAGALGD